MIQIVVIGTGLGGMSVAYELRHTLGSGPAITVVGEEDRFSFTPSNPWVAVGWRKPDQIPFPAAVHLATKDIAFEGAGAERVERAETRVLLRDGRHLASEYLVTALGPPLAFAEVLGPGPETGSTQSECQCGRASIRERVGRYR